MEAHNHKKSFDKSWENQAVQEIFNFNIQKLAQS